MKSLASLLLSFSLVALTACAEGRNPPPPDHPKPPHEKNPAFEKALKECGDTIGKDEKGRPDRKQMDECLRTKGFDKPPCNDKKPEDGPAEPRPER